MTEEREVILFISPFFNLQILQSKTVIVSRAAGLAAPFGASGY
jgi:hypothetical protein